MRWKALLGAFPVHFLHSGSSCCNSVWQHLVRKLSSIHALWYVPHSDGPAIDVCGGHSVASWTSVWSCAAFTHGTMSHDGSETASERPLFRYDCSYGSCVSSCVEAIRESGWWSCEPSCRCLLENQFVNSERCLRSKKNKNSEKTPTKQHKQKQEHQKRNESKKKLLHSLSGPMAKF